MANAIWKDYFVNFGPVDDVSFRVVVGTTTIYTGRAYRRPSSASLMIRINDICADHMAQIVAPLPAVPPLQVSFPMAFQVRRNSDNTTIDTVYFNDDWSFDENFDPGVDGMAFPVTGRIDPRQILYQTQYAPGTVTALCEYEGGTSQTVTMTAASFVNTEPLYGYAFAAAIIHAGYDSKFLDLSAVATYNGEKLVKVTVNGVEYKVADTCPRYALYYKSPFGGYDHLLLEGNCKETKEVERNTFAVGRDNRFKTRETWNNINEITTRYTMNTGLLTDEESERMQYLLDSTDVYLVDLTKGTTAVPVLIDTNTYDVKTFKGVGGSMFNYTFDLRVAQKTYRK